MEASTTRIGVLCTVRGCGHELARGARTWSCPRGHSFDVARGGYVNLLQPNDRRSPNPGDGAGAVAARARLEELGVGSELRDALESRAAAHVRRGDAALDAGAGTGLLLGGLRASLGLEGCALDISVPAVRHGSRRWPELLWIVANADRRLPFADGAFRLVLSCTGPRNPEEFRRVLAADGLLLLVVPAPDDLIELRELLQGEGLPIDRARGALEPLESSFECVERSVVRTRRHLDRAAIEDLCASTYRGARRSQRARLAELEELETTLAAEVLHLVPRLSSDASPPRD